MHGPVHVCVDLHRLRQQIVSNWQLSSRKTALGQLIQTNSLTRLNTNTHTCKQNTVMNYEQMLMYILSSIHQSEQEKSATTLTLKFVCLTTGTRAIMSSSLKGVGEENSYSLRQSCIPRKRTGEGSNHLISSYQPRAPCTLYRYM